MRYLMASSAALLLVAATAMPASAQYMPKGYNYFYNPPPGPHPAAPDACGPGYYTTNCNGAIYGPCYNILPPCQPFNGVRPYCPKAPAPAVCPQNPSFPTHPFARGPRDFFMLD